MVIFMQQIQGIKETLPELIVYRILLPIEQQKPEQTEKTKQNTLGPSLL